MSKVKEDQIEQWQFESATRRKHWESWRNKQKL